MNSEDQNHDEDAFERGLAGFQRTAPPDEWRDELIANAVPSSGLIPSEKTRRFAFRFSLPEKILGGTLAAAWLVIVSLWIATPSDPRHSESGPATSLKTLPNKSLTMIAWRFAGDETNNELLP